ncbi:winged helix-turn-helix domain-containing protein [Natronococcus sp. A-GB7]|uniref:ArsR/SmtB family transcription factor n=1 Tax=Natronococcus sp. A-GB7 TaxID=3037649 RepID=UPI00241C5FB3|nr:winged helix-turn-helix domain-containing protein [Natronococcus sp. A-GB7]MDG5821910.1 winged helix-turn-helix domain-containing protein [Natronococcus sp. A-GB7]
MSDKSKDTNINPEELTFNTSDRFDEILSSLSNTQRRRIISHLQEEGSASQSEIAHQLVRWNYDSPPDEVSDKAVERIKINLHHEHLPQLEDAGLIEYDRRSKMLLVRDLPELAEVCLDHCESVDLPS